MICYMKVSVGGRTTFVHRLLLMAVALLVMSCGSEETQAQIPNNETMTQKMYITIGDRTEPVTLVANSATQALVAKLQQAPVTVTLSSSGGFEIWGALGFSLPTSDVEIDAQPGDVVLYNGSNICMFYGTNSWSYTRLGKIDNLSAGELKTFLKAGESKVSVTLSLSAPTGISQVSADKAPAKAYSLRGTLAQAGEKGIVIQNGKKILQ